MKIKYMNVRSERFLAFYFKNGGYFSIGVCNSNLAYRFFHYSKIKTKESPATYQIEFSIFNVAYRKSGN